MDNHQNPLLAKFSALLKSNLIVKISEILLVFLAAYLFIRIFTPFAKEDQVLTFAVIWCANILMLFLVWLGIRLRGESWSDFGLTFGPVSWKEGLRVVALSLLVFVLAIAGFVLGSIIMANIAGIPQSADMTGYTYLQDNPGMLILTLVGVYLVSSFGEEVIYRAFLIHRITALGLHGKAGTAIAILLSALIFGLAHYQWGPMGVVQTTMMGLVLGIFYLKLRKRLWILILAHAYMDTILMVQMYLAGN